MLMKLSRAAIALIGLAFALPAVPAQAADAHLSLAVSLRWGIGGNQGAWTPYTVTVRNTGSEAFTGDVDLAPNDVRIGSSGGYPVHRAPITVPRGGQRSVTFYVIDAPNAYHAEARDASGHLVGAAEMGPGSTVQGTTALAVLSDLTQGDQKISAPLHALTRVDSAITHFPTPQAFPTNAVYLSGLNGIVVDDFDTAALSQAQVQAVKDFVGLGGVLIEAGGASWRRTLLPIPSDLLPMQPQATATSSLGSLWELAGRTEDAPAQVATGVLRFGRVMLSTADGTPLVIDAGYGAGSIVELTFDPFADPFTNETALAGMAWAQAISRGMSGVQAATRSTLGSFGGAGFSSVSGGAPVAAPGVWSPGYGAGSEQLTDLLNNSPAASSPPVGLLGGLLVAYVLMVGLLNYLFLHALGRRDLMWATVPLVALLFTASAYVVGFAIRGTDFYVTQVEVQRLAPGGTVETYTFSGVFTPRRGDYQLNLPGNTLASTAITQSPGEGSKAVITQSSRQAVLLRDVPIWTMRNLQTLSVSRSQSGSPEAMGLSANLHAEQGRVRGTIVNRTGQPIRRLQLVNGLGNVADLAPNLPAGGTLNVDAQLSQGSGLSPNATGGDDSTPDGAKDAVLRLAASQVLGGRTGPSDLALVGLDAPTNSVSVDGHQPSRSPLAAVVEPVALQSADSLASTRVRTRLVSTYSGDGSTPGVVDVYDLEIPRGVQGAFQLGYVYLDMGSSPVASVEVYDWGTHAWRALPAQGAPYRGPQTAPLTPGETAGGVIRARVHESAPYDSQLTVSGP
jgi:hypothetical protein